jgi:alpha-beta hydrolase superfamily lysophospholipase
MLKAIELRREHGFTGLTMAKSDEYVTNSSGQKLHVRSLWPNSTPCKGIIFMMHGYSAHCNRPPYNYYAKQVNGAGFAVILIDLHGHGYSEGMRALIENPVSLLDDVFCVIRAVYSQVGHLDIDPEKVKLERYARAIPFVIHGQSMSGGVALIASQYINDLKEKTGRGHPVLFGLGDEDNSHTIYPMEVICDLFLGCVATAPMIAVHTTPNIFSRALLDYVMAPVFGAYQVPNLVNSESNYDR